ncbi:hypothetical protein AB5J55_22405 [Streptomyces sp. R11]|uniref:Uncharacterized protein n=1 Tax=Streptomyces sp. R11 TaxID=3238625 RepID=A0AB39N1V1_9ACTN
MKSFRVRWTEDGQERESAVTYDATCAEERVNELEAREGVSNVRSVAVKPGE